MGGGEDGLLLAQIALGGVCGLLLRRSRFLEFTSSCCADRAWFPEVPPGHIRSARGLDSASLHLARGASPYGKRQSPSRLCASTTRLGDCLLPHCSLPIRTVYHNPPQKPMNFFLLLPVLPPPLPSLPPFSPPFHPFTSHFPPFLSTFLPSAPHFSILLTLSPFSLHHFSSHYTFPPFSPILTSLSCPHTFTVSPFFTVPSASTQLLPSFPHRPIPSFHFFSFLFPHHPHTSFPLTHVSRLAFSYIPLSLHLCTYLPAFPASSPPSSHFFSRPSFFTFFLLSTFLPRRRPFLPLLPYHPHTIFLPFTLLPSRLFSHPAFSPHIPPPRPHHILPFLPPTAYGFQNIRQL